MPPLISRLLGVFVALALPLAAVELDREIVLAPQAGAAKEDREIAQWQERARAAGAKAEVYERLGWSFIAKARSTLDAGFYKLAEKTALVMERQFGASSGSRLLRGHALHNLHRFAAAEALAREVIAQDPLPAAYALLCDVLVEQGRLDEAVATLQRLSDLKPGAETYARISHVRWLKGDLAGAMAAMEMAARATSARDAEAGAWFVTRLSGLALQAGDAARALALADDACGRMSDFPPALLARGRALAAARQWEPAAQALERATALNPLPEYQWWLADVWREAGREAEARKVEAAIHARGAANDPRTYALFLATRQEDAAQALRLAREELAERRDVFTHDAVAWALLRAGEVAAADAAMRAALAEKTADARLFLHAGEIARRLGRSAEAARHFERAANAAGTLTPSERTLLAGAQKTLSSTVTQTQP